MLNTEALMDSTAVLLTDGRRKFVYRLREAKSGRFVDVRDDGGVWRFLGRYEPKAGWLYAMEPDLQRDPAVRGFRWLAGAAWSNDYAAIESAGWRVQLHKG
jgi:hypothetical protein